MNLSLSESQPLVSCLCVTNNRPALLKRAIQCYFSQTYPSKELVVIAYDSDIKSHQVLELMADKSINLVKIAHSRNLTLGALRNIAIENSKGDYFCQWDDDDWHHNSRIEMQIDLIIKNGKVSSSLINQFMYDELKKESYLSSYGPWAGTIMCKKSLITHDFKYPDLSRGEDSHFLNLMMRENFMYPVLAPSLYIYVYHGNNTWNEKHFKKLFANSKKMSRSVNDLIESILNNQISNAEASKAILDPLVLKEVDYFYFSKPIKRDLLLNILKIVSYLFKRMFEDVRMLIVEKQ